MSDKITVPQKSSLYRLLKRQGFVPQHVTGSTRTGPMFRKLFALAGTSEPVAKHEGHIPTWPSVDNWIDGLSMKQASAVLSELMEKIVDD